jgi:hypothetical protein
MQNLLEDLKAYFDRTPQSKIDTDWEKYDKNDEVGPKVSELLTHFETQIQNVIDKIKKPENFGLFDFKFVL